MIQPLKSIILVLIFILGVTELILAQTFCYPLTSDVQSADLNGPTLNVLANGDGQTGQFITTPLPENFCVETDHMRVYRFEDNAGLSFISPEGFLDCAYTVEFLVNFEQLPWHTLLDSPWIWLFGTTNGDDGIFIYRNQLFGNLDLEFWDSNTRLKAVPFQQFNTSDYFHFTITRNCSGLVEVYVNCEFLADFDDRNDRILEVTPQRGNQMIFFQDDPEIIQTESAPGKVRDLRISNFIISDTEIAAKCDCICESALESCTVNNSVTEITCNPSAVGVRIDTFAIAGVCACACDSIVTRELVYEPQIQIIDTNIVADQGEGTGSITIEPGGGAPPYQANWSTGNLGTQVGDLAAGNYEVSITDDTGCQSVFSLFVPLAEKSEMTTKSTVEICQGETYRGRNTSIVFLDTLSGSSGDSIVEITLIVNPVGEVFLQETICEGEDFLGFSQSGTYREVFSNPTTGCDSIVNLNLTVLEPVITDVAVTICEGSSYEGFDTPGRYVNVFSSVAGCDSIRILELSVGASILDTIVANVCVGETYEGRGPGTYREILASTGGCDSIVILEVQEYPPIELLGVNSGDAACTLQNGFVEILAEGGTGQLLYRINDRRYQPKNVFTGLAPGEYALSIRDDRNCTLEFAVSIGGGSAPVITDVAILPGDCKEEESILVIEATGGNPPFQYTTGATFELQEENFFFNLPGGTYEVAVIDANGCAATQSVTVPTGMLEVISAITPSPAVCGDNGGLTVDLNEVDGNYSYSLDGLFFQSENVFDSLAAGNYRITVKNDFQCIQVSEEVEVRAEVGEIGLVATMIPATGEFSNGQLSLEATSGTPPFEFRLADGVFSFNNSFTGLPHGFYTVEVRDARGCVGRDTFKLPATNYPDIIREEEPKPPVILKSGGEKGGFTGWPSDEKERELWQRGDWIIFDLTGRPVYRGNGTDLWFAGINFPPGVYFFQLRAKSKFSLISGKILLFHP